MNIRNRFAMFITKSSMTEPDVSIRTFMSNSTTINDYPFGGIHFLCSGYISR